MAAASAAARRAVRSSGKKLVATIEVHNRRHDQGHHIVLVERQRALEKASRFRQILARIPSGKPTQPLNGEVNRVRICVPSERRASAETSSALSSFATRATISSCMSKKSAIGLSNRSAQRWFPLSA